MNVGDALDYLSYCSFRCNGTTLVAEINRRVMLNREKYYNIYYDKCDGSMYKFLIYVNDEIHPDTCPGSCSDPRFLFSAGSSSTEWSNKRSELLSLVLQFYSNNKTVKRQKSLQETCRFVLNRLICGKKKGKNEFCGVGSLGANQFLHIGSLIGLFPLYCFTYAEISDPSLGPAKIIQECHGKQMPIVKIQDTFCNVTSELRKVWNDMITNSLVENTLCELSRSVKATRKFIAKGEAKTGMIASDIKPDVILNDDLRKESSKHDLIFCTDKNSTMQNMFHVTTSSSGATPLRPCLLMRDSRKWSEGTRSIHNVTNWTRNAQDKSMVYWKQLGSNMNLNTQLCVSVKLEKLMKIR